jgi:hypothetical protein
MDMPTICDFPHVWLAITPAHVVLCTLARLSIRRVDWTWPTLLLPTGLSLLFMTVLASVLPPVAPLILGLFIMSAPLTLWVGMLMLLGRPSTAAEQLKTPDQKLLGRLAMLALITALGISVVAARTHGERKACTPFFAHAWLTSVGLMALALERSPRISLKVVATAERQGRRLKCFAFEVRRVVWPVVRQHGLTTGGYVNLLLLVLSVIQAWPAVFQITCAISLLGALVYMVCLRRLSGINQATLRAHASPYLMGAASLAGMQLLGLIRGVWWPQ